MRKHTHTYIAFVQLSTIKGCWFNFFYRKFRKKIFTPLSLFLVCNSLPDLALLIRDKARMLWKVPSLRGWGSTAPVQALTLYSEFKLRLLFVHKLILFWPHASRPLLIYVAYNSDFLPAESNLEGLRSCKSLCYSREGGLRNKWQRKELMFIWPEGESCLIYSFILTYLTIDTWH